MGRSSRRRRGRCWRRPLDCCPSSRRRSNWSAWWGRVAFGPVWRGIADALRTPRLAAPLYLANVLAAMVPASLGLALFGRLAGERPWASELIGPEWGDQVVEVAAATVAEGRLAGGAE